MAPKPSKEAESTGKTPRAAYLRRSRCWSIFQPRLQRTVNLQSCKLSAVIHTSLSKQTQINSYWDEPSKNAVSLQASWFFKKLANRDAIFLNCIVVVMQLYWEYDINTSYFLASKAFWVSQMAEIRWYLWYFNLIWVFKTTDIDNQLTNLRVVTSIVVSYGNWKLE